jgi:uncharacterized membrane protein YhaH (DUF805 family)
MDWYMAVLRQYANFTGRSRRKEYWFFALFNLIIAFVLAAIDYKSGLYSAGSSFGLLSGLYSLAVLLPSLGVSIRRLHDTDRTGWWLVIGLVPLLGFIVLLIFFVSPGTQGVNRYGADPTAA